MQMMGLRYKTANLVRCDLCHQPTHQAYRVTIGGLACQFCGSLHAQMAVKNYEEKISKGVTPNNPKPLIEESEDETIE